MKPASCLRASFVLVPLAILFASAPGADDSGAGAEPRSPSASAQHATEAPGPVIDEGIHDERPGDPWMPRSSGAPAGVTVSSDPIVRGPYVSVQVNVDEFGNNIPGDAANEPSIAVDPRNPDRIVIGWRQFDTVESSFRQAGWAYSHDGGKTWTFPGVLEPGVFRSDPVLDSDAEGNFYYYSLRGDFSYWLYRSTDGGVSWDEPVFAFGGDKGWTTIDKTDGPGGGNIYATWSGFRNLTRSTDGGQSFMEPIAPPVSPSLGTLSVGLDGELYAAGGGHVVKWVNAWNDLEEPIFEVAAPRTISACLPELPPPPSCTPAPNPGLGALLGQTWIATDHSTGPTAANVYVLDGNGRVFFWRSTDGGATWSDCIRINDDPVDSGAWHWFGTMSVAPNGRIDVVWNDTRNFPCQTISELFFSFSEDGGETWSENIPVSPPFDHFVGFPRQAKLGDYYDMVSDDLGASIAYAATFRGEQDIYYLRLNHGDCNENGIPDACDMSCRPPGFSCDVPSCGISEDCNNNGIPDECEPDPDGDAIIDDCDNCPDVFNPEQIGTDGDGVGDACDNCPFLINPDQADCNEDGRGDACTITTCPEGDRSCQDCNQNGVPDACDLTFTAVAQLVPTDECLPGFGEALAFSADSVVARAASPLAHTVLVFERIDHVWQQTAKIDRPEGEATQDFGRAVAIDGSWLLVGATNPRTVYAFRNDGSQWIFDRRFDFSASSMVVEGDVMVLGVPQDPTNPAGAAYVLRFDGKEWVQEAELLPSDGVFFDHFGFAVDISGDTIVVGARLGDGVVTNTGAVYVYKRVGDGWIELAKLAAEDGMVLAEFGWAVAVDNDVIVVGAPGDSWFNHAAGGAYVYEFKGDQWTSAGRLIPSDVFFRINFGASVRVHDDAIFVSSRDAVFAFRGHLGGWKEAGVVSAGSAIGLERDTIVVRTRPCELSLLLIPSLDENANGMPDECEIPPRLVIKPGGCPNALNPAGRGVVPIALVSTPTFDVQGVDLESLELVRGDGVGRALRPLSGQSGGRGNERGNARSPKIVFEDVAGPFENNGCACHETEPDGLDDLVLKFDTQQLVEAFQLDSQKGPRELSLTLRGRTLDGTPIESADCIRLAGSAVPRGLQGSDGAGSE